MRWPLMIGSVTKFGISLDILRTVQPIPDLTYYFSVIQKKHVICDERMVYLLCRFFWGDYWSSPKQRIIGFSSSGSSPNANPTSIIWKRRENISRQGDVYSNSIKLMETFTRKKPTDEISTEGMSLRSWVDESLCNTNLLRGDDLAYQSVAPCIL